ncbi:MAG: lamin tail domain-containing protein [Candidatus Tenebribacter burtonii]|nr:lamin tail domain-containing protein [Candidatus Tenebribacter burtonii]
MKKTFLFILGFLLLTSLVWGLFISQNCDPRNNYAPDRFAEIYNPSDDPVDLTDWTLENVQGGSVSFTWTLSGSIASGEALVCGNIVTVLSTITPDFQITWVGTSWNGKGSDGTILKNASGTIIDYAVQSDITGTFENKEMVRNSNIATPTTTYNAAEWTFTSVDDAVDATPGMHVCDFPVGSSPTITLSISVLSDFSYVDGSGPSAEQSFTAEGSNLTADISIAPPTDYEVSLDNASYQLTPITLTQTGGAVATTTIYVRLIAALSAGAYNSEEIICTSTDADNKIVTCNGDVFKLEPTNHVTGFAATAGGFSVIDLGWTDAVGSVLPDGYLIKGSDVSVVAIVDPIDGIAESDGGLVLNVAQGLGLANISGLTPETTYYFNIYSYTNTGTEINYKLDGSIPNSNATTDAIPAAPSGVYISEYIEGSSDNKALEIFNGSGSTIYLDNMAFPSVSNAPTTIGEYEYWNTFTPGATIAPNDVYVIAHPSANSTILAQADMTHYYLSNGDDGYAIVWGSESSYEVLDWLGDWDGDPGSGWDVAGTTSATYNHTLVRKSTVTSGNTDWASSAGTTIENSEWEVYDVDTFTYLGSHSETPLPVNLSSFYALYIGGTPTLYWTTQTETENAYWNVYRGTNDTFDQAMWLNANDPVPGNGTINTASDYIYVDNAAVVQNTTYWYWIEDVSLDGETEVHEPINLTIPYEDIPVTPDTYGLHQNYPNPFNPSTLISFTLEEESDVELFIYNIKGEKIKEYAISSDQTSIVWDGTDQNDQPVSSGVYFYKLITDTKEYSKKMLLVK